MSLYYKPGKQKKSKIYHTAELWGMSHIHSVSKRVKKTRKNAKCYNEKNISIIHFLGEALLLKWLEMGNAVIRLT